MARASVDTALPAPAPDASEAGPAVPLDLLLVEAPPPGGGAWAPVRTALDAALDGPAPAPHELFPLVPPELQRRRDDNWLAWRVGRVRPDPFALLFERHWRPVFAFCLSLLGRREEAEDAAQEAMARAYATLSARRDRPDFRPWLFAIARNTAMDRLRERSRRDEYAPDFDERSLGTGDAPADVVDRRDSMTLLMTDLRALSERQRAALVLRELSGMSHEQIGATLETTPARTKSLISDARQALAERKAGRELPCEEYRRELASCGSRNPRGHRLVAHHESCGLCRGDRRSGVLSIFPLPFLLPLLTRFGHKAAAGAKAIGVAGGGAGAKVALSASLAVLAVPIVQHVSDAPDVSPAPATHLAGSGDPAAGIREPAAGENGDRLAASGDARRGRRWHGAAAAGPAPGQTFPDAAEHAPEGALPAATLENLLAGQADAVQASLESLVQREARALVERVDRHAAEVRAAVDTLTGALERTLAGAIEGAPASPGARGGTRPADGGSPPSGGGAPARRPRRPVPDGGGAPPSGPAPAAGAPQGEQQPPLVRLPIEVPDVDEVLDALDVTGGRR